MEIKKRIQNFFHREKVLPVVEGPRRMAVPDGIMEDYKTVFAVELLQGEKSCGARFYYFKDDESSTKKTFLKDMDLNDWQLFKQRLQTAKDSEYIEFDERKVEIPLSLAEGQHGVYAVPVSLFDKDKVEFVSAGVNIYRVDEKQRVIPVRSMNSKVWHNYQKVIEKTKKQEETLRANIMNFENNMQK